VECGEDVGDGDDDNDEEARGAILRVPESPTQPISWLRAQSRNRE
jgi:hypothetical protein